MEVHYDDAVFFNRCFFNSPLNSQAFLYQNVAYESHVNNRGAFPNSDPSSFVDREASFKIFEYILVVGPLGPLENSGQCVTQYGEGFCFSLAMQAQAEELLFHRENSFGASISTSARINFFSFSCDWDLNVHESFDERAMDFATLNHVLHVQIATISDNSYISCTFI